MRDGVTTEDIEELGKLLGVNPYRRKGRFPSRDGKRFNLQIINGRIVKEEIEAAETSNLIFMTPDPVTRTLFQSMTHQFEDHDHHHHDDHGHHDHHLQDNPTTIEQLLQFVEKRRREYETPVISEESGRLLTSFPEADLAYVVSVKGNYIPNELFNQIPQEVRDNVLVWYIMQRAFALAQLNNYKQDANFREYQRSLAINLAWFAYESEIKNNPKYKILKNGKLFGTTPVGYLDYLKAGRNAYEGLSALSANEINLKQKDRQPEDMQEALAWAVLGEKSVSVAEAISLAERFRMLAIAQNLDDYIERWSDVVRYFEVMR
ncbi:hypothetical protein IPH70_01120 [Candidatus Roizmanbacteria bacterium]|nr:MAG: hypothetical protein IPH70_01120 [Candidatus Roizmanbacteria bacterium]